MPQNLSLSSLPGEGLRVETSALAFIVHPPSSPSVDTLDGTMRTQHGLKRFPFFFLEISSWLKRCDQAYIATELYHFSGISIKQKHSRFGPSCWGPACQPFLLTHQVMWSKTFFFLLSVIFVKVLGKTFKLQQTGDACGELMLLHMCDEKIKLLLDLWLLGGRISLSLQFHTDLYAV